MHAEISAVPEEGVRGVLVTWQKGHSARVAADDGPSIRHGNGASTSPHGTYATGMYPLQSLAPWMRGLEAQLCEY